MFQEVRDPHICLSSDAVVVEFMSEQAVVHLIKCLGEIHDDDICLETFFGVVCDFFTEFTENVVLLQVIHHMADQSVLKDFTGNSGEGYGSVVG